MPSDRRLTNACGGAARRAVMNGKQAQPAVADAPTAAVRAARYRGEPRSPNGPSGVHIRSVATEGPHERCYRGFGVTIGEIRSASHGGDHRSEQRDLKRLEDLLDAMH